MSGKRDRHGNPMYGSVHKAVRKRFAQRMKRGEVFYCWRPECRKPIDPAKWDLGHVDAEHRATFGSRWPECRPCNRATLPRMLAEARGESAPKPVPPGNPVSYGNGQTAPAKKPVPPDPPVPPLFLSRHWTGGDYRPDCRDCWERGSACDEALSLRGLYAQRGWQ